jgi:hypothetical protein
MAGATCVGECLLVSDSMRLRHVMDAVVMGRARAEDCFTGDDQDGGNDGEKYQQRQSQLSPTAHSDKKPPGQEDRKNWSAHWAATATPEQVGNRNCGARQRCELWVSDFLGRSQGLSSKLKNKKGAPHPGILVFLRV